MARINRLEVLSVSLLEVTAGLEPPSGLLGGASRLRAMPPGFSMVGGFCLFRITSQAGLGPYGL